MFVIQTTGTGNSFQWLWRYNLAFCRKTLFILALAVINSFAGFSAQAQSRLVTFDIPAGSLAESLEYFEQQTDIRVEYNPNDVEGVTSNELSGQFSVEQGLINLLPRQGFSIEHTRSGFRISQTDINTETMLVVGYADAYKSMLTATKTDVPILQTSASIQVIDQQTLTDQAVLNVDQAVKNVSGVYENIGPDGNTGDNFLIRGFRADAYGGSYRDGVKDFSRAPAEIAGLERIEVSKGPAAILYGRIEPGGLINRVSKKPLAEGFTEIQQQVGTDSFFRTTLDSTGPLVSDSVLYRINVARDDSDGFKDFTYNKRLYIAPQITWNPGDATTINFGVEYIDDERSWALTYGTIGDENGPVDIPIETNLHDKDDIYLEESYFYRLQWAHEFSDAWQVRSQSSFYDRESVARATSLNVTDNDGNFLPAGNYQRVYWGWDDEQVESVATNIELVGKFSTGAVNHTLLAGADYFKEDHNSGGWSYGGTPVQSNIHNPVYVENPPYDQDRGIDEWSFSNEHRGIYIQDQMSLLSERLHIMLGARNDDASYVMMYAGSGGTPENRETTYRAGILFQATPNSAIYTSYVEGFGAPQFDWGTGNPFEPETSHQLELGTKLEFGSSGMLNLALFELVKDNLTRPDPLDPTNVVLAGEATSQGIEVDINGDITESFSVLLAYAYTDTEWTNSESYQGEDFVGIPKHGLRLWLTYQQPDSPLKFGLGSTYRSDRRGAHVADYPENQYPGVAPYTLDEYNLIDAMISYDFVFAGVDMTARLNGQNLSDERYYPTTYYGSLGRIELGTPRSIIAAVSAKF